MTLLITFVASQCFAQQFIQPNDFSTEVGIKLAPTRPIKAKIHVRRNLKIVANPRLKFKPDQGLLRFPIMDETDNSKIDVLNKIYRAKGYLLRIKQKTKLRIRSVPLQKKQTIVKKSDLLDVIPFMKFKISGRSRVRSQLDSIQKLGKSFNNKW